MKKASMTASGKKKNVFSGSAKKDKFSGADSVPLRFCIEQVELDKRDMLRRLSSDVAVGLFVI
jgi:hypothetical protein